MCWQANDAHRGANGLKRWAVGPAGGNLGLNALLGDLEAEPLADLEVEAVWDPGDRSTGVKVKAVACEGPARSRNFTGAFPVASEAYESKAGWAKKFLHFQLQA